MSIEDVERIMDETKEAVEYQRVCIISVFTNVCPYKAGTKNTQTEQFAC